MSKVSLTARYATFTDETQPTTNFFNRTGYMAVDGTSGKRRQAVVWFASPFGPEGGNVLRATLTVKSRRTKAGTHSLIAGLATKWDAQLGKLNFKNRPGVAGVTTTVTKTGVLPENTPWAFDVTRQLQAVADGQGMYGFVIYSTTADLVNLQGQMGGGLNPLLEVEWTLAPKPPASLSPSGGRSVGETKPTLRWSFFDHAGSETLNAVQVQISTTASFASPQWDSGIVATHACSMDLGATSFGGVPSGQTVYWRVRNQDGAGLWSQWSNPQAFRYDPLPGVTLQNPSPTTPFIVDPTPPIDWTTTGTVTNWRVEIYVWDGRKWGLQDTSGEVRSAATSWTPTRPLKYRNGLYMVCVYVGDDRDREATPGVQPFGKDSEEVQFIPDGDTTSAYLLAARSTDGTPSVTLTWQQTQQPDQWLVYRDGKLLARCPGSALLKGNAPNYGFIDRWCPAGEHTWTVYAIANGKSWPSGHVTATVDQVGTWLVNTETQKAVCFVGDVDHDMELPEDVTVHYPLGATHGVAITGAQRGYEGTLSGVLVDSTRMPASQTARIWHDNLLTFKRDVGQEYLLLIEDMALPVKINSVSLASFPGNAGKAWRASLSWRQVDDLTF